eukprot:scaffold164826_cov18-Tisochrysis_lutea.AAC.1
MLASDIAGAEDSLGDMDFKIAGSEDGLTAMQLDMKLPGMPVELKCDFGKQGNRPPWMCESSIAVLLFLLSLLSPAAWHKAHNLVGVT